ncbi:hypothetical protein MHLP_00405 [Candidatus Mycoplasma haematolamae str. Purdue]|uniref:Uncharacterized protein n=1 Tax=Mycoplasma haematolamae (strain Purdue) TaxID=1212765 RepID=I7CEJ4_MYCHA|nr:hypothetical protein [Candidatus Mycoplasma haematolamae]AFO51661.1 hypothetical protein MHLP_00405 [Candidatus Mycoplasma haematolamae str. Purdue]
MSDKPNVCIVLGPNGEEFTTPGVWLKESASQDVVELKEESSLNSDPLPSIFKEHKGLEDFVKRLMAEYQRRECTYTPKKNSGGLYHTMECKKP